MNGLRFCPFLQYAEPWVSRTAGTPESDLSDPTDPTDLVSCSRQLHFQLITCIIFLNPWNVLF